METESNNKLFQLNLKERELERIQEESADNVCLVVSSEKTKVNVRQDRRNGLDDGEERV